MKKRIKIILILILILSLVFIFYPRKLSNLITSTKTTANESIIWLGEVAENHTLSKEQTEEILNTMDQTSIKFAGFCTGWISLNEGDYTYHLLLINRSSEELTELGSFTFDGNGYVYVGKFKYKLINQDEILNIIKTNVNK